MDALEAARQTLLPLSAASGAGPDQRAAQRGSGSELLMRGGGGWPSGHSPPFPFPGVQGKGGHKEYSELQEFLPWSVPVG